MVDWKRPFRKMGIAIGLRDPPNLPAHGWSYFDHLVAVYVNLNADDIRAAQVINKSRSSPDDLTWGDIFLLENIILSLQPPEVINRTGWIIRERFRDTVSSSLYEKYMASDYPKETDTPAKLALFKADLTRILDVLHWYYSLAPIRERIRTRLTFKCIRLVALYSAGLICVLAWCNTFHADSVAMLSTVVYFGVIGGFVSSQRRMQSLPSEGDPLVCVLSLDTAGYYLWLSPLLGSVFAVILMVMFISGVAKGAAFPEFYIPSKSETGLPFFDFASKTLPTGSGEYAKLFIWAFLAGFAERLVPDSLDRLSAKINPAPTQAGPIGPGIAVPPADGGDKTRPPLSETGLKEALATSKASV
jgi:hypothetical protein